jgi:hypothetical protein
MVTRHLYISYLTILMVFISCKPDTELRIAKAIKKTAEEYPQLTFNDSMPLSSFKFIKSVRNGEFDFEIQLYEQPDSIGTEKILLFLDKDNYFSIPFFPNKYKDFWQFPFDNSNVDKADITFETELNNVINKMEAGNNDIKRRAIVTELLGSVLNCKNIEEKDSLMVYKQMFPNTDIPEESSDSVSVRLRKNYQMMIREWHPKKYQTNYNCYFDEKNYRVYQINFKDDKVEIKSYRQDWGFRYLEL